jgi:hypothetical protein
MEGREGASFRVSSEVVTWLREIHSILEQSRPLLEKKALDDRDRKQLLDALGGAFSRYRQAVYGGGFSGKTELKASVVVALCRAALAHIDHGIRANRRPDGLYHAYNLLAVDREGSKASVNHLYEMLEGQVAALSSGLVEPSEAAEILDSLFESRMYRPDQHSFLLYPERQLPGYLEKNAIPDEVVETIPLFMDLLEAGEDSVLARDSSGVCRFHGDFQNAHDLEVALDRLSGETRWAGKIARDRRLALDAFEKVFHHRAFTGRSGTMYGYEGLGCIYWHQVSKLLLAVQEIALRAMRQGSPEPIVERLQRAYYRVRSGLSFEKDVIEYGAFPTDPYSHTPGHAGAQQPGMTGQVKEEILTRFGELGVEVSDGTVRFRPALLRRGEFLEQPDVYRYYDIGGNPRSIDLPAGSLAFSLCQVPVVYRLVADSPRVRLVDTGGSARETRGNELDVAQSRDLFGRTGAISLIEVDVPEARLCRV